MNAQRRCQTFRFWPLQAPVNPTRRRFLRASIGVASLSGRHGQRSVLVVDPGSTSPLGASLLALTRDARGCRRARKTALGRVGLVDAHSATPPRHRMPEPIHKLDERFIAQALRCFRKLAYGEVRLLLAGARLAEGYAPDLYRRRAPTGSARPAAHLTRLQSRCCFAQETLLPSGGSTHPLIREGFRLQIRTPRPTVAPGCCWVDRGDTRKPRNGGRGTRLSWITCSGP